jgi:hypothetical protein
MGIQHYKLDLIPRAAFGSKLPELLTETEINAGEDFDSGWWAKFPPSSGLIEGLRRLLPKDQSWGEIEEFISGSDCNSSDVRLWKNNGRFWKISFRYSAVADERSLLSDFIALARGEKCVLVETDSGLVFEPDEELVEERLQTSKAMKFARNPAETVVREGLDPRDQNIQ